MEIRQAEGQEDGKEGRMPGKVTHKEWRETKYAWKRRMTEKEKNK